jgi:hypothetical protein
MDQTRLPEGVENLARAQTRVSLKDAAVLFSIFYLLLP